MPSDDDKKHSDQFDAALPLPVGGGQKPKKDDAEDKRNTAADLIRKKVEAAYAAEPDVREEEAEIEESGAHKLSKHQKFIVELTSSGKPLHEIQMAWHEYYAALPDSEKHAVWHEFYKTQSEASAYHAATLPEKESRADTKKTSKSKSLIPSQLAKPATASATRSLKNIRDSLRTADDSTVRIKAQPHSPLHSLMFGLGVGAVVLIIFMFSFFNERFIAPFIQPSREASAIPLINGGQAISDKPELIIPKINVQIPIIYAANNNEDTVETDLESGVVHYADTAMPGQDGNLVIFGHSSNNIFNPGKYKFAFVLLKRLDTGDTFYIDNHGKRFTYEVFHKQIVPPSDVSVLGPISGKTATATLITCDPPGTSINRLIVQADQISPNPSGNAKASKTSASKVLQTKQINGNGPTLWGRFIHWLWD